MNKQIENIRINKKLSILLNDVPKGISYANWIVKQLERLKAHEENAVCWIISTSNISPNRMSCGDENGTSPVFDNIYEIVDKIPRTNMSGEERERGWLGQTNDEDCYALGGFASIDAARTYITEFLGGRLIRKELLKDQYIGNYEIYTDADFDEYWFIADWLANYSVEGIRNLTKEELEEFAKELEKEANDEGIGILGDIVEYLMDLMEVQCNLE